MPGALTLRLLCLFLGSALAASAQITNQINPPLGPYVNLSPADFADSSTFTTKDQIVATDYFYWYDIYSQAHILDGDGTDALTDHPATMADFSYKSAAWHRLQLTNMKDAGIDVLLPVSWGAPSERDPIHSANYWSFSALTPLVSAREQLLQEGKHPPRIGMFYDTSSLLYNSANQHINLTTDYGREWFYESIRDFYSLIPPKHWAMIEGHPVVFLYSSSFALAYDQSCIEFAKSSFARDFGGRIPYIVRESSWQVQTDNVYQWGGALGLKNPGVATLGPGYNDSAVPGRIPLIVDRQNGDLFRRNWTRFLQNPSKFVVVETWNEFHEGTDVADSLEYGRAYIELTRQYTDMFRQGVRPAFPRGPYSDVRSVSDTLQETNLESGLYQFDLADGATAPTNVAGSVCRGVVTTAYAGRYIYFRVDDSFKWSTSMQLSVQVDYFDSPSGSFRIEFDGSDLSAPFQGAYSASSMTVTLNGSGTWRTAVFPLVGVRFLNSQNGGADFRIAVSASQFFVRLVKVIRPGVPGEAGQKVVGIQDSFSDPLQGPRWLTYGPTNAVFQETNGMLEVGSRPGGLGYLLLSTPETAQAAQEVLARVRIRNFEPGFTVIGGVAAGLQTNDGSGFNFYLTASTAGARSVDIYDRSLPLQPVQTFPWTTNTWYWLRLQHATNAAAGGIDVAAKIWPADGLTPEPSGWLSTWDYFPEFTPRSGYAGIVAGGPGTAQLEFDYFLLKAQGLPEIIVTLPPHKPAVATLVFRHEPAGDSILQIQGEPGGWYRIESSTNLVDWQGFSTVVLTNGMAVISKSVPPNVRQRFYRAVFTGNS